nr:hypothetical protein B0A51_12506 [Rachicladosporium sp. CCFEE 5018]
MPRKSSRSLPGCLVPFQPLASDSHKMPELQTIPARHGVATFVPAGQVIKIINKTGTQVVDTWAFALPKPEEKKAEPEKKPEKEEKKDEKKDAKPEKEEQPEKKEEEKPKETPKKSKKGANDLPSQEEAEKATREGIAAKGEDGSKETPKKPGWSSYVPSVPTWSSKKAGGGEKGQTQQQKDSKTWSSYFPTGQGFSNYIPKSAGDTVSSFSGLHKRDPNKSYIEQLTDFSKTPVGAAGMAAFTGSGYGGVAYAGYKAYSSMQQEQPAMEFMSMSHSRAATLHMVPRVNDTLVSNLREPILTIIEDSGAGVHDTLIPACDPYRYKGLGVEKWEEHASCAENLVLALKELNERAGLKGAKGVGADVTINSVPAPLNLFMNIPWTNTGDISFEGPKSSEGDFVRLKAERDIVVVMSACPNDVNGINGKDITDASFVVEDSEDAATALKRQAPKKRPTPRKLGSSQRPGPPSTVATGDLGDDDKSRVGSTPSKKPAPKKAPVKKSAPAAGKTSQAKTEATPAPKKKSAPAKPAAAPAKPAEAKKTAEPAKAEGDANGTATPPVEKKKPRKLNKPAAAAE